MDDDGWVFSSWRGKCKVEEVATITAIVAA
jgi:hypothetical protein